MTDSDFIASQKLKINPAYADTIGTESYERKRFVEIIERQEKALKTILDKAKDHPMFMPEAFESRDWEAIVEEGGTSAIWTEIAILADDAIKGEKCSN